jgi:hypothetical protein
MPTRSPSQDQIPEDVKPRIVYLKQGSDRVTRKRNPRTGIKELRQLIHGKLHPRKDEMLHLPPDDMKWWKNGNEVRVEFGAADSDQDPLPWHGHRH